VTITSCISDRYILYEINDQFDKGTAMHKKVTWNIIKQKSNKNCQGENDVKIISPLDIRS
jgi:hypothetical protein